MQALQCNAMQHKSKTDHAVVVGVGDGA